VKEAIGVWILKSLFLAVKDFYWFQNIGDKIGWISSFVRVKNDVSSAQDP
jgi:hypothetical protein